MEGVVSVGAYKWNKKKFRNDKIKRFLETN